MYKNPSNAIQRARLSAKLSQEALAERAGYSDDTIRAWESGARIASLEALSILAEVLNASWLPGVYLREQTTALNALIPDFTVGRPLAEAAAIYISAILTMVDERFDRKLLRMIADGKIDELERDDFRAFMAQAAEVQRGYFEIRYAQGGVTDCDDP